MCCPASARVVTSRLNGCSMLDNPGDGADAAAPLSAFPEGVRSRGGAPHLCPHYKGAFFRKQSPPASRATGVQRLSVAGSYILPLLGQGPPP